MLVNNQTLKNPGGNSLECGMPWCECRKRGLKGGREGIMGGREVEGEDDGK